MKLDLKYHQEHQCEWAETHLDKGKRWSKQREIMQSVQDNRVTLVKSCHGVGKTYTAKDIAMTFLYTHPMSIVITTAPSWPQIEKLLWSEINRAFSNAQCKTLGGKCINIQLKLKDGWYAIGLSPRIDTDDDAKRFTGFHAKYVLIIFDEAPSVNPKLWKIKETLMTSEHVRFLGIGNPISESGYFFEGFKDPLISKISMNIFDSPNFVENGITDLKKLEVIVKEVKEIDNPKDYEAYWKKFNNPYPALTTIRWAVERYIEWGKESPIFQSRVLGQFPKVTTNTIIALTEIEACQDIDVKDGLRVLGVDVARFGDDFTVFTGYNGSKKIYRERWNGQDTVKTSNRIKYLIRTDKYQVIVIDDTGVGGGVTDQVRTFQDEKQFILIPVNFAEKSSVDEYDGIITEMWYNARDLIRDQKIEVKDEGNLFSEMTGRKYKFTPKGKMKVESKEDYKKRTGSKSPDDADSFILCCYGMTFSGGGEISVAGERTFVEDEDNDGERTFSKKQW